LNKYKTDKNFDKPANICFSFIFSLRL